jgi:hypothetical protein
VNWQRFSKNRKRGSAFYYPKNYVIAAIPSFDAAKAANEALRHVGLNETESGAVPGSDLLLISGGIRCLALL